MFGFLLAVKAKQPRRFYIGSIGSPDFIQLFTGKFGLGEALEPFPGDRG
jgi:hypothetical protein